MSNEGKLPRVTCNTTKGIFVAEVHPEWSPLGAKRYLELVEAGYWDGVSFFRVIPNFIVQFGIAASPEVNQRIRKWGTIQDDPPLTIPFVRGTMAFAGSGNNSRDSQIFISYADSDHLGKAPWETPFGKVVEGMETVSLFYSGYGDLKVFGGKAPDNDRMHLEGAAYIRKEYPEIDYIHTCKVLSAIKEVAGTEKKKSLRSTVGNAQSLKEQVGDKHPSPNRSPVTQGKKVPLAAREVKPSVERADPLPDEASFLNSHKEEPLSDFSIFPFFFFIGLAGAIWLAWKMTKISGRHQLGRKRKH